MSLYDDVYSRNDTVFRCVFYSFNHDKMIFYYVLYSLSQVSAYFIIFFKKAFVHKKISSKFSYPLNRKT